MNRNIITAVSVLGACTALLFAISTFRQNHEKQMEANNLNYADAPNSHWEPTPNASGLLLASHVAQLNRDWGNANTLLNNAFKFAKPDVGTEMRAMALALGAGDTNRALALATQVMAHDGTGVQNPESLELACILLASDHVRQGNLKDANDMVNRLQNGPIAQFVRPLFSIWLAVAENKPLPAGLAQTPTVLLHKAMAAELNKDTKTSLASLKSLVDYPRTDISSAIAAAIALRAGDIKLAREFLPALPDGDATKTLTNLKEEIDRMTPGGAQMLDWHLKGATEGLSIALLDLSNLLLQQRAYDSAMLFARMGSLLAPNFTALTHVQASVYMQEERLEDAANSYRTVEQDAPGYYQAQLRLADIYAAQDKTDDAIALLKNLEEQQNNSQILYTLGDLYRREQNNTKAIDAYTKAIAIDKAAGKPEQSYWFAYYFRGMTHDNNGDWKLAEADLQKAISLNDQDAHLLNYLGYSWAEKGENLLEAAKLLDRALQLAPADPYIIDSVGWVAFQKGDLDKAQRYLELAVTIKPYDPTLNDHIGDLYVKLGRTREAQYQYLRALSYAQSEDADVPPELIPAIKVKLEKLNLS